MLITKELLHEKRACSSGVDWFNSHFPSGGEYQLVLDKAAETDQTDYGRWLLNTFGTTEEVLEVESIEGKHIFFAGTIRVKGSISISGHQGRLGHRGRLGHGHLRRPAYTGR